MIKISKQIVQMMVASKGPHLSIPPVEAESPSEDTRKEDQKKTEKDPSQIDKKAEKTEDVKRHVQDPRNS